MSWNLVKILSLIVGFMVGVVCYSIYEKAKPYRLNEVEYANYCTLNYKIEYIAAADSLIETLMARPGVRGFIEDSIPESYIRYCYYAYYLPDCENEVDYERYKEDFDL